MAYNFHIPQNYITYYVLNLFIFIFYSKLSFLIFRFSTLTYLFNTHFVIKMNFIIKTLFICVILFQIQGNFGFDMIPKELIEGLQLIAESKFQFLTLQEVPNNFIRIMIQNYFLKFDAFIHTKNTTLYQNNNGYGLVYHGMLRKIVNFEEYRIPNRVLIIELKSDLDKT